MWAFVVQGFFGLSGFYGWNLQRIFEEQSIGRESWDQVRGKLFGTWLTEQPLAPLLSGESSYTGRRTWSLVMRSQSSPQLNTVVQWILQCSTAFADLTPGVCFTLVGWLIQSHTITKSAGACLSKAFWWNKTSWAWIWSHKVDNPGLKLNVIYVKSVF